MGRVSFATYVWAVGFGCATRTSRSRFRNWRSGQNLPVPIKFSLPQIGKILQVRSLGLLG